MVVSKKEEDKKIISLTKKLKKVDDTADGIDELEERKVNLTNSLNKVDERVGEIATLSEQFSVEETELNEKIKIYKENKIDKKHAQLEQYKLDKSNNQIEIDKLKIEVKNKLDKIDKLGNLEHDPDCDFCMSNPFTLDAMETKKRLNEDKDLADKFVKQSDNLDSVINGLSHITAHKQQILSLGGSPEKDRNEPLNEQLKKLVKQHEKLLINSVLKNKEKNKIKEEIVNKIKIRFQIIQDLPTKELRSVIDQGKKALKEGIVIAYAIHSSKLGLAIGVTEKLTEKYSAVEIGRAHV